jgi:hypothetical protein
MGFSKPRIGIKRQKPPADLTTDVTHPRSSPSWTFDTDVVPIFTT